MAFVSIIKDKNWTSTKVNHVQVAAFGLVVSGTVRYKITFRFKFKFGLKLQPFDPCLSVTAPVFVVRCLISVSSLDTKGISQNINALPYLSTRFTKHAMLYQTEQWVSRWKWEMKIASHVTRQCTGGWYLHLVIYCISVLTTVHRRGEARV